MKLTFSNELKTKDTVNKYTRQDVLISVFTANKETQTVQQLKARQFLLYIFLSSLTRSCEPLHRFYYDCAAQQPPLIFKVSL